MLHSLFHGGHSKKTFCAQDNLYLQVIVSDRNEQKNIISCLKTQAHHMRQRGGYQGDESPPSGNPLV